MRRPSRRRAAVQPGDVCETCQADALDVDAFGVACCANCLATAHHAACEVCGREPTVPARWGARLCIDCGTRPANDDELPF